jgi:hypothetical protein
MLFDTRLTKQLAGGIKVKLREGRNRQMAGLASSEYLFQSFAYLSRFFWLSKSCDWSGRTLIGWVAESKTRLREFSLEKRRKF